MKQENYEFWLDSWAKKIIEREEKLGRKLKILRTESGLGASGIPHIGSLGDVIRQFGVTLALRDMGFKSEVIAYSDDRDGLRKVPLGLPNWLEKYIGKPVTDIPDPFGCCKNYGEHMNNLLIDGIKKVGIDFKFQSGTKAYKSGMLDEEIEKILLNSKRIGESIQKITGQEKYLGMIPYFPVCEKCGKIYTTRCYEIVPEKHKVLYICDQEFRGENKNTGRKIIVKGCGYKGEVSYLKGNGKLAWKTEFAARWKAQKIVYEAVGKDVIDSVRVNDEICRKILGWEPPLHFVYEMFLEKGGRKISKSIGNVFTPQTWLKYGSPESLFLLMFKRSGTIRSLDITDIPSYMLEVDRLEDIYFGIEKLENPRNEFNAKRLFEFIHKLKSPKKPSVHLPYEYLVQLAGVAPKKNKLDFVIQSLKETGHLERVNRRIERNIEKKLEYAENWFNDFEKPKRKVIDLTLEEQRAIRELIEIIKRENDGEKIQTKIFEISKKYKIKPSKFFRQIYRILINQNKGPRLGPYIIQRGKDEVIKILKVTLKRQRKEIRL